MSTAPALELRTHQKTALTSLRQAFTQRKRVLLSLPTGTGKTITAATFAKANYLDQNQTVVWIAHTKELLDQAFDTFVEALGVSEHMIGRRYGAFDELDAKPSAPLWLLNNAVKSGPGSADFLVIDEAHHAPNTTYRKWLSLYGAHRTDGPMVLGLTATPYRLHEGEVKDLCAFSFSSPRIPVFEQVAFQMSFCDLAQVGAVAPFRHVRFSTHLSFKMAMQGGEFSAESLRQLDTPRRNQMIVDHWRSGREKYGKTLIFVGTKEHAQHLGEAFGVDGDYVVSGDDRREEVIENFRRGRLSVLVNVGIFKEGVDVPDIRTVVLARPTASPGLFTQMVGRGSRILPDKKFFYLIDVHDQLGRHEGYLAGLATLADQDEHLIEVISRRSAAAERVAELGCKSLSQDPGVLLDIASMAPRTILREFAGWIVFEHGDGTPSPVAALLTEDELQRLARHEINGCISPAAGASIRRTRDITEALEKCATALKDGLIGRLHRFSDVDIKQELPVLMADGPVAVGINSAGELKGARGALKDFDAWGRERGVGELELGRVRDAYVTGRADFGGVVCLTGDRGAYLQVVGGDAIGLVRETMETKTKRSLSWLDATLLLTELERLEPDLQGNRLIASIERARDMEEVGWVPG